MNCQFALLLFCISLLNCSPLLVAQQPYVGVANLDCGNTDNSSSVLGYTCNGQSSRCQAYLIFRSRPPYDSVSSISRLLNSDPSQISQANSVPEDSTFTAEQEVIVPVNCSCSGQYYQANSSYVIAKDDSYFFIANHTYQGLSTCQALQEQNGNDARRLLPGQTLNIPLRCACPTANQSREGVNYLLSYLVVIGDTVYDVSQRFNGDVRGTLDANSLTTPNIYPFTTLLIPLQNPPSSSQTIMPPPPPPWLPPAASSPSSNRKSKTWVYVIVAVVVGLVIVIASIVLFYKIYRRKRAEAYSIAVSNNCIEKFEGMSENEISEEPLVGIDYIENQLKVYKFEELKSATSNFSPDCNIGGSVYHGVIEGDSAAIKIMTGDASPIINFLSKINHFNLIRLSGICLSEGHWYLVYEFAQNGRLTDWIHGGKSKNLSWIQRIQISLDIANGLNYLHTFTEPSHVHKHITSSTILLDADLRAKITNFGMMRSTAGEEGNFALTRHIVGTRGYMAPEYLEHGLISSKLDVYAFGVVLLEIVSGKESIVKWEDGEMFLSEAFTSFSSGKEEEMMSGFMDPALGGDYPPQLAVLLGKLVRGCLSKDAVRRPSMDEVARSLEVIFSASLSLEFPSEDSAESKSFQS